MKTAGRIALDRFDIVVLGCSSGGFDALSRLLPAIAADARFAVVVGIHLAPEKPSLLADVLGPKCKLPMREPVDKERIEPGTIYCASPGYHLLVEPDRSFSFSVEDPVNFSRPSLDVLFESVAWAYGTRALGILLTGANHDGARGIATLHEKGGATIVQDPNTAENDLMPRSALSLFKPDAVLSLAKIRAILEGGPHGSGG